MSTREIDLTLAQMEDDSDFEGQFNDWQVKPFLAQHVIDEAALRTICRIWYGRGIARGTTWSEGEVVRALKEEVERLRRHVRDLDSDLNGTIKECNDHHGIDSPCGG